MKRYDLVYRDDDQAFMEEDKEGEYVYANEATARIAELEAENAKLREALKVWTQSRTHTCASPEFMELMRNSLVALGGEG